MNREKSPVSGDTSASSRILEPSAEDQDDPHRRPQRQKTHMIIKSKLKQIRKEELDREQRADVRFVRQIQAIRKLSQKTPRVEYVELWIGIFVSTRNEQTVARNRLMAVLLAQLQNNGKLGFPFVDPVNCQRNLQDVWETYHAHQLRVQPRAVVPRRSPIKLRVPILADPYAPIVRKEMEKGVAPNMMMVLYARKDKEQLLRQHREREKERKKALQAEQKRKEAQRLSRERMQKDNERKELLLKVQQRRESERLRLERVKSQHPIVAQKQRVPLGSQTLAKVASKQIREVEVESRKGQFQKRATRIKAEAAKIGQRDRFTCTPRKEPERVSNPIQETRKQQALIELAKKREKIREIRKVQLQKREESENKKRDARIKAAEAKIGQRYRFGTPRKEPERVRKTIQEVREEQALIDASLKQRIEEKQKLLDVAEQELKIIGKEKQKLNQEISKRLAMLGLLQQDTRSEQEVVNGGGTPDEQLLLCRFSRSSPTAISFRGLFNAQQAASKLPRVRENARKCFMMSRGMLIEPLDKWGLINTMLYRRYKLNKQPLAIEEQKILHQVKRYLHRKPSSSGKSSHVLILNASGKLCQIKLQPNKVLSQGTQTMSKKKKLPTGLNLYLASNSSHDIYKKFQENMLPLKKQLSAAKRQVRQVRQVQRNATKVMQRVANNNNNNNNNNSYSNDVSEDNLSCNSACSRWRREIQDLARSLLQMPCRVFAEVFAPIMRRSNKLQIEYLDTKLELHFELTLKRFMIGCHSCCCELRGQSHDVISMDEANHCFQLMRRLFRGHSESARDHINSLQLVYFREVDDSNVDM